MNQQEREKLQTLFSNYLTAKLDRMVFGHPVDSDVCLKVKVRPVRLAGELAFQREAFVGQQVFHENLDGPAAAEKLIDDLEQHFRHAEIWAEDGWAQVMVSKKGKVTVKEKKHLPGVRDSGMAGKSEKKLSHNREKRYLIPEGTAVPFLVDLGVMTGEGKIVRAKYDKFRQINRYLEFIEDILPALSKEKENVIVDFGCGKSYLTFAMYYYLHILKAYPVRILGLDLKKEVIEECRRLSRQYGFAGLSFHHGDIASFTGIDRVDMVVSLHACDTATDYAIDKAVKWGAKVIFCVPCCQHELNARIKAEVLQPVFRYGILKERIAALCTDGIRGAILESLGYQTQILEFIDMEHTPKNILIRGVKKGKPKQNREEIQNLIEFLHVSPTLAALYQDRPVIK